LVFLVEFCRFDQGVENRRSFGWPGFVGCAMQSRCAESPQVFGYLEVGVFSRIGLLVKGPVLVG
jgi:hypothetical protein